MKPPEILSMIEEAAGTRMFETKKQAALKTIEKKQLKVDEITHVMDEDIIPTLEKLKVDKANYLSFMSNNVELEQLERFVIAFEYCEAEKCVRKGEEERVQIETDLANSKTLERNMQAEIDTCAAKKNAIEQQRDAESEGEFQQLKRTEQDISKDLVKLSTAVSNENQTLTNEKETFASISKQVQACETTIEEKKVELKGLSDVSAAKEAEATASEANVAALRERYQNAIAGVTDESNSELLSIPEQVLAWEKRAREATSQMQQGAMKASHTKEQLKDLKKAVAAEQAAHAKVIKEGEDLRSKVTEIEKTLATLSYNESEESSLRTRQANLKKILSALRDEMETLNAQLQARLKFEYKDPEKGFDKNRVKGVVANLITVKDQIAATALEVAASGKLMQVVVDTEVTANAILKNGALKKRVTFIPLNKIDHRCTDPAKLQRAKQIAKDMGGNASLALELVDFDESVRNAIEHVFGNTIVCSSAEIAKAVAFDPSIRIKTVTLEGDVMSPGGTMSGGSRGNLGEILSKVSILNEKTAQMNAATSEVVTIVDSLKKIEAIASKVKDLKSTLDVRRHALEMCESKMAGSKYAQSMGDIERLEAELVKIGEVYIISPLIFSPIQYLINLSWKFRMPFLLKQPMREPKKS